MKNDNQRKLDFWMKCATIGIIVTIILFFLTVNQEDHNNIMVPFVLFFVSMAFSIVSVVMVDVYNAKVKNMNANEYINDRFKNSWKETKELFGPKNNGMYSNVSVRCPYCNSYNTTKISALSKAIGAALIGVHALARNSKEWHCNNCNSDF